MVAALSNRGLPLRELARFDEALEQLDRAPYGRRPRG